MLHQLNGRAADSNPAVVGSTPTWSSMKHKLLSNGKTIITCETSPLNLVDFTVEIATTLNLQEHTDLFISLGHSDIEDAHGYLGDIDYLKTLAEVYAKESKMSADDLIKQEFEKVAKEWDFEYDTCC